MAVDSVPESMLATREEIATKTMNEPSHHHPGCPWRRAVEYLKTLTLGEGYYRVGCAHCGNVYDTPLYLDDQTTYYIGLKATIAISAVVHLPNGWEVVQGEPWCPMCAKTLPKEWEVSA